MIWHEVKQAESVHAAVPGDVGTIGLLVALFQSKRLFVRHCGTFGEPQTISDHILLWILEHIAGGRNVILATGGSDAPPSKKNPNITWIFSTTLSQAEFEQTPKANPWSLGKPLRLITVCRLAEGKNVQAILRALPVIRDMIPDVHLDVLGDGEYRSALENLVRELRLADAVTFHGNVNHADVLKQLSTSHLFVFPTRVKEGFPKAVLEALACGLPVIATRVSVIPQLLKTGAVFCSMTQTDRMWQMRFRFARATGKTRGYEPPCPRSRAGVHPRSLGETIGQRLRAAWGTVEVMTARDIVTRLISSSGIAALSRMILVRDVALHSTSTACPAIVIKMSYPISNRIIPLRSFVRCSNGFSRVSPSSVWRIFYRPTSPASCSHLTTVMLTT